MPNSTTEMDWKQILERIKHNGYDPLEYNCLVRHLQDCEEARAKLLKCGYGHPGMSMSEIASLVVPF